MMWSISQMWMEKNHCSIGSLISTVRFYKMIPAHPGTYKTEFIWKSYKFNNSTDIQFAAQSI